MHSLDFLGEPSEEKKKERGGKRSKAVEVMIMIKMKKHDRMEFE